MITTTEVNTNLLKISEDLKIKLIEKNRLEKAYYEKYYNLLLNSGMGNMAKQEAEAKLTMMNDPIYEKYKEAELDIKLLYIDKEIWEEIGRNRRNEKREEE